MGKKSPSAPTPPDPAATAAAQGTINRDTAVAQAQLNMIDEFTPYGSSVFSKIGAPSSPVAVPGGAPSPPAGTAPRYVDPRAKFDEYAPLIDPNAGRGPGMPSTAGVVSTPEDIQRWRRTITLSPEQQAILDSQNAISGDLNQLALSQIGRVNEATATPFSFEGMPAAPVADANARQQVIDALYGDFTSRLDPQFEENRRRLETQLVNEGHSRGGDAYTAELDRFGRTRNDAYSQAMRSAVQGGGAEQSRLFGLQGAARERAIQEASFLRNLPLNEVSALMGAGPGISLPQFAPAPQTGIQPADITGPTALQYQGQLNNYNQQLGARNAAMGGLFGLGGSALGGFLGGPGGAALGGRLFGG